MDDAGVKTDNFGRVDLRGFLSYRSIIEAYQPLEKELETVKLSFLPSELQLWSNLKALIKETIWHRQQMRIQKEKNSKGVQQPQQEQTQGDKDAVAGTGVITNPLLQDEYPLTDEEMSFVLANVGIIYSRRELIRAMVDRTAHEKLIDNLDRRFVRLHLKDAQTKFTSMLYEGKISMSKTPITSTDLTNISIPKFLAWVFARRPSPQMSGLYRALISLKFGIFRRVRWLDAICKTMYDYAMHVRLRMVYRTFEPISQAKDRGDKKSFGVGFTIGKGLSSDDGLSINWSLSSVAQPEEYLQRLRLPRDCGTVLILDFLLRSDCPTEEAEKAAESLKGVLLNNCVDELKKSLQYRGIFVFPTTNEGDGATVLRVAFAYRRIFSLDMFFSQSFIPYTISGLLPEFSGELKTSIQLVDMFTTSTTSLDTQLSCSFILNCKYMRDIILSLLQRTWLATSCELTKEQVQTPKTEVEESKFKHYESLRSFFPSIASTCKTVYKVLYGINDTFSQFKFKGLSDLLFRLGNSNLWFKRMFPNELGTQSGYLKGEYEKWKVKFTAEILDIYNKLKDAMENRVRKEEEEQFKRSSKNKSENKEDLEKIRSIEATKEKLRRLGIEAGDDIFTDVATDPMQFSKQVDAEMDTKDVNTFIAYERLCKTCLGLHCVEVFSGQSKFTVALQGLDFFELLPEPPPMASVKESIDVRLNKLAAMKAAQAREGD